MHLKTQYLGSCCWCWFRFCWSSSCHSCWVWLYRNVSHEKASAVLAVLRRIITCLNFPGDCIGANKLPYKGACSYVVDCIIIWWLLWEWEYELNSRQPLQRAIFLFVRTFLNRSPASFRTRTESCYWLTVGKDFIGSFGADWPYWAQLLHASHVLDGLLHSCPKEDFTYHTYLRFSTKVFGVDLAKHVLLHRLR